MTDAPEPGIRNLVVRLDANGVSAPVMLAMKTSLDAVAIFMKALEGTDLDNVPALPDTFFSFKLDLVDVDASNRRLNLVNWILGKALHELARSIRLSLEEAYFYIEMAKSAQGRTTDRELQKRILRFRRDANAMDFPSLMEKVSAGLTNPLSFSDEFAGLQKARNCLEHNNGLVGIRHADEDGNFRFTLPYMYFFIETSDGEIEVHQGLKVEEDTHLKLRRGTMTKSFGVGERITITANDLNRIAQACFYFATDLRSKLPTV